ncbi:MAG: response regulator [Spirochaetia bacterium]
MTKKPGKNERIEKLLNYLKSNPNGYRRADLARKMGVHRSTIGRYIDELSKRVPIWEEDYRIRLLEQDGEVSKIRLSTVEALSLFFSVHSFLKGLNTYHASTVLMARKISNLLIPAYPAIAEHLEKSIIKYEKGLYNSEETEDKDYFAIFVDAWMNKKTVLVTKELTSVVPPCKAVLEITALDTNNGHSENSLLVVFSYCREKQCTCIFPLTQIKQLGIPGGSEKIPDPQCPYDTVKKTEHNFTIARLDTSTLATPIKSLYNAGFTSFISQSKQQPKRTEAYIHSSEYFFKAFSHLKTRPRITGPNELAAKWDAYSKKSPAKAEILQEQRKKNDENFNVLLIEDEAITRLAFTEILNTAGFSVETSGCAGKTMERIKKGAYDLIITDLYMPDISGFDILRVCNQHSPKTAVLVITAYSDKESAINAFRLGAVEFLEKPLGEQELIESAYNGIRRKQQELDLAKTLIHENNHRTKNQIAMLTSLLKLQMRKCTGPDIQEVFVTVLSQIQSVQALMEDLTWYGDEGKINLREYLQKIIDNFQDVFSSAQELKDARIEFSSADLTISNSSAVIIALILNELIMNSYKHVTSETVKPEISIQSAGAETIITYQDNGDGFTAENQNGEGLSLIRSLISQIEGRFETTHASKAKLVIIIPTQKL